MLPRHPLRDRFVTRLDEHLRRDLAVPEGARLRPAFSAGPDSTALVAALAALAPVRGFRVEAVHVHHGLQRQADAWAEQARATAERLGVGFRLLAWEGTPGAGESEEAAARRARYGLLERSMDAGDWVMTAHHADDQAETVLLYLTRGAGLDGLSGIERRRAFGAGWLARPLLPFRRAELAAWVEGLGLATVSDPGNRDPRFARARVRDRLLPCLAEAMGGEVSASVARSADLLQDAREVLEGAVEERLAALWRAGAPPALAAAGLAALPAGEGRLVLRAALRRAGQAPPAREALDRALRLAARDEAAGRIEWQGGGAERRGGWLWLTEAALPAADGDSILAGEGGTAGDRGTAPEQGPRAGERGQRDGE
ncbi:MAG TPA: tRNA lysidine(34) synthetase TilS [Gammaproteobacteria bacterium]|nr:tRNA lysidine(34) synthetase TilS [Gammaproteobacteria bacterium]